MYATLENLNGIERLENVGLNGKIILKCIFETQLRCDAMTCIRVGQDRVQPRDDFCEHSDGHSAFLEAENFL